MYWSVLGCILAVEYVAEWLIFWIPFYFTLKTLFLLWLALPQTAGASILYSTRIQPFFAAHEKEIDSALTQLKNYVYNYLQRLLRNAWGHVVASTNQAPGGEARPDALDEGGLTGEAAVHSGNPPTLSDPLSGPAQLVQTFWRSYGPMVVAAGSGFMRQAQSTARASAQATEEAMDTPPAGPSRLQSSSSVLQSVLDRRRQLEAELAALDTHPGLQGYDVSEPARPFPPADGHTRTSSPSSLRERPGSGNGKFEEVEVPSDIESEDLMSPDAERPQANKGWFGWSGKPQGYERVKTE
ncbi:uncharacterized protein PHACADRAFT_255023 [Phanerochaete carnosa HHB-10118-sp]|uniref:Protein YOP1 n=1 Tax=Phanerochaete carnosa (strain HHB-10118-sp) TaxID=650164 RepID=K5W0J4_PHACS|nr:uncharacterized protein PHACADRAFT_255023 [Phanerochaete carnosa HHB-10118-sp]EKM57323.1 hypothetical protein PHACADRAFT_255023 [Phanerochaete carnosa HHB-10118-sp]